MKTFYCKVGGYFKGSSNGNLFDPIPLEKGEKGEGLYIAIKAENREKVLEKLSGAGPCEGDGLFVLNPVGE